MNELELAEKVDLIDAAERSSGSAAIYLTIGTEDVVPTDAELRLINGELERRGLESRHFSAASMNLETE